MDYGWADITQLGGVIPQGAAGGFDLGPLVASTGRDGVILVMRAMVDGQRVGDPDYAFEAKVTGAMPNIKLVVRCPDCNYMEEFAYDPQNPAWMAGYLHQALNSHVERFARWRLTGNELTWSQRAGLPEVPGDGCSPDLARFLRLRLNKPGFRFEQGAAAGWWMGEDGKPANAWGDGPVATVGQGGGDPVYISRKAREALQGQDMSVERVRALDLVEGPALWLQIMSWVGVASGALGVLNLGATWWTLGTIPLNIAFFSLSWAAVWSGGGLLSLRGLKHYQAVRPSLLVYFTLAYVAFALPCCVVGAPISAWATYTWLKPEVKQGRMKVV